MQPLTRLIVSRHVTIPDVAPSLPDRVTHQGDPAPPRVEQDTIGKTSVFVHLGYLGRSQSPAGKRNGHDDHGYLRCFVHLDWAGPFYDTQGSPGLVNEITRNAIDRSIESTVCQEPSSPASLRSPRPGFKPLMKLGSPPTLRIWLERAIHPS